VQGHDEKCTRIRQRAKLLVPSKKVKNVSDEVTAAAEVVKPDAVPPTKEGMNAPDHATTEIRNANIAKVRKLICEASGIHGERSAERILYQLEAMQVWGVEDCSKMLAALDLMIELKPANAVEAMLTVQMVGAHEAALMFLKSATTEGQTSESRDTNVLRATRLMRLFNEQLEAMAKLKGKTGHQKARWSMSTSTKAARPLWDP
jgi:hypothetical protein